MTEAEKADAHALYERSVQSPPEEVAFITRQFKKLRARKPLSLREDFCGTAVLSAEWVKSDKQRTAVGIDLDAATLQYAREKTLLRVPSETAARVTLFQRDVRSPLRGEFDVACAYNYSWWALKTIDDLRRYFRSVHGSLTRDGIFFLDLFGGSTAESVNLEPRRYRGFTYVWEQASYNPIDADFQCHIHFRFRDGSRLDKAFSYDWRLWRLAETREHLAAAGFSNVRVYWQDDNGYHRERRVVENEPSYNVYVIAER